MNEKILNDLDFVVKEGDKDAHDVTIYTLSTCGHCKRGMKYLDDNDVKFRYVYFDLLPESLRDNVHQQVKEKFPNDRFLFPFIIINEKMVIVGFHPDKLMTALEIKQ
ncbi:MAG: glutaredoxin family protein [Promethearchaeota archaeon]